MNEEHLREIVARNVSIKGSLEDYIVVYGPVSYGKFRKNISKYNIDISHFMGGELQRSKMHVNNRKCIYQYFVTGGKLTSYKLKNVLIDNHLIKYECETCKIKEWNGKKLTLQLDHINGVNNDNRMENLRLLCANCHSQTSTYCGRNIKHAKKEIVPTYCAECNTQISKGSTICRPCSHIRQERICWPGYEELKMMIETTNFSVVGRLLGVSPNAVGARMRKYISQIEISGVSGA